MSRILIVDDEPQILRMLRASLTSSGYDVVCAANGMEGFEAFRRTNPDLVITDMSMPELDGVALTEEIRRLSKVPIIILSVRDAPPVKVSALDTGADDYVTKPFSMPELLARVRVHLRRDTVDEEDAPASLEAGHFVLNLRGRTLAICGYQTHLTPKEFTLLSVFMRHPDEVITHRDLAKAVWGAAVEGYMEKLRVLVAQLRRKIETGEHRYIRNEPWVGYRFEPEGVGPL